MKITIALITATLSMANISGEFRPIKPDTAYALTGATLITPGQNIPITDKVVLVRNGIIQSVQSHTKKLPAGFKKLDFTGKYIVPGYIDSHVHFFQSGSIFTRPDSFDYRAIQPYAQDRQWVKKHMGDSLNRYLKSGVTTVVDLCGPKWTLKIKATAQQQGMQAPRIFAAGTCLSSYTADSLSVGDGDPVYQKISTPDQAKEAVVSLVGHNADLVKLIWSEDAGITPQGFHDLFKPAIDLAHQAGMKVAIHTQNLPYAKMAVRSGADMLVHGAMGDPIDDEFLTLLKQEGTIYMPTMIVHTKYGQIARQNFTFSQHEKDHTHPDILESFDLVLNEKDKAGQLVKIFKRYLPYVDQDAAALSGLSEQEQALVGQLKGFFSHKVSKIQADNLLKLHQAAIPMALGTDAGNPGVFHGASLLAEMRAWHQAGVPTAAILKAVTQTNAMVVSQGHRLGSLSAGKKADLLILSKNPLESVNNFAQIDHVMKAGIWVKK